MTEWRRTLRSWPTETSKVADPNSLPDYQRDPARLREANREEVSSSLVGIALGSLLPMGLGFAGTAWFAAVGYEGVAALTMFASMALGVVGLIPMAKVADEWRDARRRRRTLDVLDAQGEATLGGEFVGVAYEERLWHHPGLGFDADLGVLTLELDRLNFVGLETRFEIPRDAILSTEIRSFDAALHGAHPRLYVQWIQGDKTGTFSVSLPTHRRVDRRVEAMAELRSRLDAWRGETMPRAIRFEAVVPPSEHPAVARTRGIGLPAKILAAVATFLTLGFIEFVATMIAIQMGWKRTGTLFLILAGISNLPWSLFSRKIERHLPERWRYQDKTETGVDLRDALGKMESIRHNDAAVEVKPNA